MFFPTPNQYPATLDTFRQYVVNKRGFQAQSRYYVQINVPTTLNVREYSVTGYPEAIQFSQKNVTVITDEVYTMPRRIPVSGDMGDILLSFVIYQDWRERRFFEAWMDAILNYPIERGVSPGVRSYYSSFGSMNIVFVGNEFTTNQIYTFTEVMPNSLTPIAFDADGFGKVSFQVLLSARSDRFSGI